MYQVRLSRRALKDADRLPAEMWQRVLNALRALREDPRPRVCIKIRGEANLYRIRVGDYRALYDIDDTAQIVMVLRIQHRKEAYRDL